MTSPIEDLRPPPVVVVGASAGGVEALRDLVLLLPAGLPACVLIVLHIPADAPSALPAILRRRAKLPVRHAEDGARLRAGEVLVAPPDYHLVVADGAVALTRGPRENGHRPAVDVLFRAAARDRGADVLGLVLSGALDDGAAGSVTIAAQGGRVAVQSFDEALYSSMPRAAAQAVRGAEQRTLAELAELVDRWADQRQHLRSAPPAAPDVVDKEVEMAQMDPGAMHDPDRPGTPSGFGCPDCAGSLFQIEEGGFVRYRCRVGHAWSSEALLARQSVELEGALWMALRTLEEKAALNDDLEQRAGGTGNHRAAARFGENAREVREAAESVRRFIAELGEAMGGPVTDDEVAG